MTAERPPWWGWGEPPPFPDALASLAGRPTPPAPIEDVRLPESRLPDALREHARVDREEQVQHATGKN